MTAHGKMYRDGLTAVASVINNDVYTRQQRITPVDNEIMRMITKHLRDRAYNKAYLVWMVNPQAIIKRLAVILEAVHESTAWSGISTNQCQAVYDHHDLFVVQFMIMLKPYVESSSDRTSLQQLTSLWKCMHTPEYVVWTYLITAVLEDTEDMSQFFYKVFQTCQSRPEWINVDNLQEASASLSSSYPEFNLVSLKDYVTIYSKVFARTTVEEQDEVSERQFRWLFRVCGRRYLELSGIPYMIQRRFNDWICDQLNQKVVSCNNESTRHIPSQEDKSLIHMLNTQTDLWTSTSSLFTPGINNMDMDDDDLVRLIDLAASPIVLKHSYTMMQLPRWWSHYLKQHTRIPLHQDAQLLNQLVFLFSDDRGSNGMFDHSGPVSLDIVTVQPTDLPFGANSATTGEFIVPSHGAILRWLWNGMYRSVWPVGTCSDIKQDFAPVKSWLDHVFLNSSHTEVFAALYVFQTPEAMLLYESLCKHIPPVITMIVFNYLSTQAGSGGEYDTVGALLQKP